MNRNYLILLLLCWFTSCKPQKEIYLYTSFHEPAKEGLRLLWSKDAYHWNDLGVSFLKPLVGNDSIMRDPSVLYGKDGLYHLVWTSDWKGNNGFGYASSKDLVHWSPQRFIPVMQKEPGVLNVWAPELFYDDETAQYIIVWASTIPFRFAKGTEEENNNHRLYYTTTTDFNSFSDPKVFFDARFSEIDATIVQKEKGKYVLVFKDNTRSYRNIRVAFADHALGPYTQVSEPFTPLFSEGPAVARAGNDWLIYYDAYRDKKFGAVSTRDFKTFTDISDRISVPPGHKHGTIFKAPGKVLKGLKKAAAHSS